MYDLAGGWFCGDCGRPIGNRWLMTAPSGCATCDETITRHRCTGRPSLGDHTVDDTWECPDCRTIWLVGEELDTCRECGRSGTVPAWTVAVHGDRIDSAPRYNPVVYTPLRNALAGIVRTLLAPPPRTGERPRECYRMPSGARVHIKPGCRC
jgi:hypothetical protein